MHVCFAGGVSRRVYPFTQVSTGREYAVTVNFVWRDFAASYGGVVG